MALSKIDVSKMITGVTPLTNGGTGGTSIPATNLASGVTGTLPVASGGTGLTSGTTDQFLKFTGTTTVASSALGATGKIGQVLTVVKTPAANSTTGTSFVSPSGAGINITPSATSSKILVSVQGGGTVVSTNTTVLYATIYRGSTNLGSSSAGLQRQYNNQRTDQPLSMQILDSPNSTSQQTYAIYYRSETNGAQVYMQDTASGDIIITAMEVLA